jgi:hypothetical protein
VLGALFALLVRFGKRVIRAAAARLGPYTVGVLTPLAVLFITGDWRPFQSETAPLTRTEVRLFAARGASGNETNLPVTQKVTGECSDDSVNPVPGVVNCGGDDGHLYVSCFGAYDDEVLCVASPWAKVATPLQVRLYLFDRVGKKLGRTYVWDPHGNEPFPVTPRAYPPGTYPPWALELANGLRCLRVIGSTSTVAGGTANYRCSKDGEDNGRKNAWVIGYPSRRADLWRVSFIGAGATHTEQVAVRAAYY